MLTLSNVHVSVQSKPVVKGISLKVKPGEIHALMGTNGSGKTSLAYALSGHPSYTVNNKSRVSLNNKDLLELTPNERAQAGLFLAFQYPVAIPGISVQNFLKTAYENTHCANCMSNKKLGECSHLSVLAFRQMLKQHAKSLGIDPTLLTRSLNDGFSGGEKKRVEVLQLLALKPKIAILDESDSGLDIDSIKLVAKAINRAVIDNHTGCIVITHYTRLFEHLKPTHVHIMLQGKLVKSGGPELISKLDSSGYSQFKANQAANK
jgi:Fe-S cluster assembly ATP-binding protein